MDTNAFSTVFFLNPFQRSADPATMDGRLRARLSRGEIFAIALTAAALVIFLWLDTHVSYLPYDYAIYLRAAHGDMLQYYYADWLLPLFALWSKLPFYGGYILWNTLNFLGVFFAARVFGGRGWLALLTFQWFYALFLGQITGLMIGALAYAWWALAHKRWALAGLGFWLASTKFQIGIPYGLLLWLAADIRWRDRLRVLIPPVSLSLLSLIVYPGWPVALMQRIHDYPPYDWASISLWQYMGPVASLLLLPPLLLPLENSKRLLAIMAAIPLALPYFQQADLLVLYVFPLGWLPILLGNTAFLFFKYSFDVLRLLWFIPLTLYLFALTSDIWSRVHKARPEQTLSQAPNNKSK